MSMENTVTPLESQNTSKIFFSLTAGVDWVPIDRGPHGEGPGFAEEKIVYPSSLQEAVDIGGHFRNQLWTHSMEFGQFHLLRVKMAPDFRLPRHRHNLHQIVFVTRGQAQQGSRVFKVGDGWSTPAEQVYSVTAGPEGCETVEVRFEPIGDLTTTFVEENPAMWGPRAGRTTAHP
jgi:quercetin dioxygenase-like cupin family protein